MLLLCPYCICLKQVSFGDHLKACGEEYSFYLADKVAQIHSEFHYDKRKSDELAGA